LVGCIHAAHDEDTSLAADVLLENLVCKAAATMALRTVLAQSNIDPSTIDYVLNSGEEAVGDRYQRGGGNLAKAVAEMCGCAQATGADVKGFCCGPVHAMALAAGLVSSRIFRQVAVIGGCSLAKLGMKFQGHLRHDQPILEDVLAGVALLISADDGRSPKIRLDAIGRHTVAAGSSQQAIIQHLVAKPLELLGLRFQDIDKYATELHNPEVTEPAGSGNVPLLNYRVIAGLAALRKEITPADVGQFVTTHGMPGFSPTQGHIASAIPFLGHALDRMRAGTMQRAMFLAKGSLFLGRMTQMADGLSFILEAPSRRA
jgi:betaine reductase